MGHGPRSLLTLLVSVTLFLSTLGGNAAALDEVDREYCFKLGGTATEGTKVWIRWRNVWYSTPTTIGDTALDTITALRNQLIAQAPANGDVVGPIDINPSNGVVSFCLRGPRKGLGTIRFHVYEDGYNRSGYKRVLGPKDAAAHGYSGSYLGTVSAGELRVTIKGFLDGLEKVLDIVIPSNEIVGGVNEGVAQKLDDAGLEAVPTDLTDETGAPVAGFFVPSRSAEFDWIEEFTLEFTDAAIEGSATAVDEALARINEVDADQTMTDAVEFFELAGIPDEDLTGYWVVFYNGNGDGEYFVIDLAGQVIPPDGYFVVGVPGVPEVDLVPLGIPATNAIQNGADAIALYRDPSGTLTVPDFQGTTVDTPPAGVDLIDAIVYGTSDPDDVELLSALTPNDPQADENGQFNREIESLQRRPNFGLQFDTSSYMVGAPSPGKRNTWSDEGSALPGASLFPDLLATGDLSDGSLNALSLGNAAPTAQVGIFFGLTDTPTPFKGGTLLPVPIIVLVLAATDAAGALEIPFVMPSGVPADVELWIQMGIQDAGAPFGVSLSNAVLGVTP